MRAATAPPRDAGGGRPAMPVAKVPALAAPAPLPHSPGKVTVRRGEWPEGFPIGMRRAQCRYRKAEHPAGNHPLKGAWPSREVTEPGKMATMVEKFFRPGDDERYRDWLAANPCGYVVNLGRSGRSRHKKLHRATCKTIKELHGRGTTFVDQWVKWCSTDEEELQEEVAKENSGARAERCEAPGVGCWLLTGWGNDHGIVGYAADRKEE
jgi:hypothetical protein